MGLRHYAGLRQVEKDVFLHFLVLGILRSSTLCSEHPIIKIVKIWQKKTLFNLPLTNPGIGFVPDSSLSKIDVKQLKQTV